MTGESELFDSLVKFHEGSMSNIQWRRVRVMARAIIEECEAIDKSQELSAELARIKLLADGADEISDIPRIYTEAPETEFAEMPQEIQTHYQEMLSYAKRLARVRAK